MHREFLQRDNLTPLALEGMLLELLAQMTRESSGGGESQCPRWLRQAQDFLHAHFTESLSVEAVAAAAGVHPSHLMRGFRRHCRCTIGDYVRRLRVEYACHLLSTSGAPAAEIARTVGFADQSHFTRTFKGCTGMTPAAFQKVSGRASRRQELIPSDNTAVP
jgi:AraC family transcriptional regulator